MVCEVWLKDGLQHSSDIPCRSLFFLFETIKKDGLPLNNSITVSLLFQGICKFGFYEVFKILYSGLIGEENAFLYRTSLYLAASASAEFIADIALSPMEAVKVCS